MLIGYMRVSKADGSQTLELQRDALLAAGVNTAHLYDDHASGRSDVRPGLASCLKALRDGDTLFVWKLDRLGRDLHHPARTVMLLDSRQVSDAEPTSATSAPLVHSAFDVGAAAL